jgi:hypothetical protein
MVNIPKSAAIGAVLAALAILWDLTYNDGWDQIKATQKARTDFSEMCAKQDGTVVTNYKGTPNKLCFSADGRLVGSY